MGLVLQRFQQLYFTLFDVNNQFYLIYLLKSSKAVAEEHDLEIQNGSKLSALRTLWNYFSVVTAQLHSYV